MVRCWTAGARGSDGFGAWTRAHARSGWGRCGRYARLHVHNWAGARLGHWRTTRCITGQQAQKSLSRTRTGAFRATCPEPGSSSYFEDIGRGSPKIIS